MAIYDRGLPNGYVLRLEVNQGAQDIAGNYSTGGYDLRIIKGSGSGKWTGYTVYWSVTIGGVYLSGSVGGYDFRAYTQLQLAGGSFTHGHNADGTLSVNVRGAMQETDPAPGLGTWDTTGVYTFSTIPRASTASISPNPIDANTAMTINTNRASTAFYHTVEYYFGSAYGVIGTNILDTVSWTPPLSLLNEIPNSAQGTGTIRVTTYTGSTNVGYKDTGFTLNTPATVVPTIGAITDSEATAGLAANVGAYVQGLTKLLLGVTGAAGVYGSTIASYKIDVGGQTVNAASGTTPSAITSSGTVVITATVTDTRGRAKTLTKNITVLPYAPPAITAVSGVRALASGVPDDEGTYIRVNINAAVQSLVVSTVQKNTLKYKISTRLRGDTTWVLKKNVTPSATGVTFNSYDTVGTYPIDLAYDVLIEIYDDFLTTAVQLILPTSTIFMHWDAQDGVGIGKYRQYGMLDVLGQIYQRDGKRVLDVDDFTTQAALNGAYVTGVTTTGVTVQVAGTGTVYGPYRVAKGYRPRLGDSVMTFKDNAGNVIITGAIDTSIALVIGAGWRTYNAINLEDGWSEPKIKKTFLGIVQLSGLISGGTLTSGTIIGNVPTGYRPDTDMMFFVSNSDTVKGITVKANGDLVLDSTFATGFIDLGQISYPAAGVATWTNIGAGGSSFGANMSDYGAASYGLARFWKDTLGFVWMAGLIKSSVAVNADNTPYVTLPVTHAAYSQLHFMGIANGVTCGMGTTGTPFNTIVHKVIVGVPAGAWISLAPIMITTADARSSNTWINLTNLLGNGWAQYPGAYSQASYTQRIDGLTVISGLMNNGTMGQKTFRTSRDVSLERNAIFLTQCSGSVGRIDLKGEGNGSDVRYDMAFINGNNVWHSVDNIRWIPD